jgi:hypothetical protein
MNLDPLRTLILNSYPSMKVFIHQMPETIKKGALILPPLGGAKLDQEIPGYKRAKFQIICRDINFQSGYDAAKALMTTLKVSRLNVGNDFYIHRSVPLHDPMSFPKSAGDYFEHSVNFEIFYSEN